MNELEKTKSEFKELRCENDKKHCESTSAYTTNSGELENEIGDHVHGTGWIIKSNKKAANKAKEINKKNNEGVNQNANPDKKK